MDLLINFDSPAAKKVVKYDTRSPLIPSTRIQSNTDSPNSCNPFDAVINVVGRNQQPNDPFDLVLQASLQGNSKVQPKGLANQNNKLNETFDKDTKLNETFDKDTKQTKRKQFLSSSLTEETNLNISKIRDIKEFISNRVTSIERTINTSFSQVDLTKLSNDSRTKFRRSFSAGMLRTRTSSADFETNSQDLNVSAPLGATQTLSTGDGTFTYDKSSPNLNDQSDNKISERITHDLMDEAKKLSKLISTKKVSSDQDDTDSIEDLFDVRPLWETEDILTDEEQDSIGLPKLKSFRHSFSEFSVPIEEETVKKYIKRRSSDWGQPEETSHICHDITKQTLEAFSPDGFSSMVEDLPKNELPAVQIELNLVNEIANKNQIRFKKKTGNEIPKKGPLKAFMPIQKMSKNLTTKLSQFKSKPQQSTTNNKANSPVDNAIRPIAASTPTKSNSETGQSSAIKTKDPENKSSTDRKILRRSSSVEVVERNLGNDRSNLPKVSNQKVSKTDVQAGKESLSRPHSAPDKSNLDKARAALTALGSRPFNRGGKIPKVKNLPVALSAQDKENQVLVKNSHFK